MIGSPLSVLFGLKIDAAPGIAGGGLRALGLCFPASPWANPPLLLSSHILPRSFFVSLVRLRLHPLLLLNPLLLLCVALLADLFAGLQILEDCYLLSIVLLPLL